MARIRSPQRLRKELGLSDVFAISTGAMFSSGFFLLPGLAAAKAGPSVALAYLLAGFLIVPAMLSAAELSTAMPRAGGAYYFIDRSLGPAAGTVGGIGTWIALVLKSAFALIGMGAYIALFVHVPIEPIAVGLTLLFVVLNVVGAKETTGLQKMLVFVLIVILGYFLVQGLVEVVALGPAQVARDQFTPFMPFGLTGLLSTVGFVFVSYAGLTKVASVAEEVSRPDRNIPLGMLLSLAVATVIYVLGVLIIVAVLDAEALWSDLTPVATAASAFFDWLPGSTGLVLIVIAAIAAFASTANAGVMASSRYLLAMSRDGLLWSFFARLGRFHTPTLAVLVTGLAMIVIVLALDVEGVAKLASAFQLLLFAMLNFVVIVMRESRIESYDPGYRSPFYPWTQLLGIVIYLALIVLLGWLPSVFTASLIALSLLWYRYYARAHVVRTGAIYHVFERLGRQRFVGLDRELREIIKEKGLRDEDPFDEIVARAFILDPPSCGRMSSLVAEAADKLHSRTPTTREQLAALFEATLATGLTPIAHGAAVLHTRLPGLQHSELALARCRDDIEWDAPNGPPPDEAVHAVFFLVSGNHNPGWHLRILGALASRIEDETFMGQWLEASSGPALKSTLLRTDRVLTIDVRPGSKAARLAGLALRDIRMPTGCLVALIRRHEDQVVPRGDTVIREGDELTIIGEPDGLRQLQRELVDVAEAPAE